MMWRLLAAILLSATTLFHSGAFATQPDFISEMTFELAVNPAVAEEKARQKIADLGDRARGDSVTHLAEAHWVMAQAMFRQGELSEATAALARAEQLAGTDPSGLRVQGYVQLLKGLLARAEQRLGDALLLFGQAHRKFITTRDRRGQALALQSIGVLYTDVSQGDDAARYFDLAREAFPTSDTVFQLSWNNNYGVAEQVRLNHVTAERFFTAARSAAQELGNEQFANQIGLNILSARLQNKDLVGAQAMLRELSRTAIGWPEHQRGDLRALRARLALEQGDTALALDLIQPLLAGLDPETSTSRSRSLHWDAYRILREARRWNDALVHLEAVRRIDQADAQIVSSNRAALLAAQFQFEAQNTRIAELKAEGLEREVDYQRTVTLVLVVGGLIVLGLLAGLLVTAIRARNRARADGAVLAHTNRQLEQALAAKTEFLASTSHELRTPLNGILGMTQVMLADPAASPRLRTQIELLHDAGTTMRALVDDILDVAKIEHGGFTITPRPTDAEMLIRRVVRLFEAEAGNRGLVLDVDVQGAGMLELDPDRLTQILFNLIGNAIKFTQEGSITICADRTADAAQGGELLRIAVADTGIGIAPEWHGAVFEMFRQVDGTRTRHYGGTGLGLAICRQLARAMGGDIALASTPGEGSTFTVTLPAVAVAAAGREAAPAQPEGGIEGDGAPCDVPAEADLAIVAVDPLRVAMLCAIARRVGRTPWVADTPDRIAAAIACKHLTLLIDEAASQAVASMPDACGGGGRDMILVGQGAVVSRDTAIAGGRTVAFSRNAIAQALRPTKYSETAITCRLPSTEGTGYRAPQSGENDIMARASRV